MLDSNNLINIKARLNVAVATKNTTSVYLASRKLERQLKETLKNHFEYPIELDVFVDKIIEKTNSTDVCQAISTHLTASEETMFIQQASKIKSFMIMIRQMVGKAEIDEEEIIDEYEKPVQEEDSDDVDLSQISFDVL